MKKCPTCNKTFDDGLRFCQTDGTPLVEVAETSSEDPYKTIVAGKDVTAPPDPFKTIVEMPSLTDKREKVLEFPEEPDMLKTMVSSPNKPKDKADADDIKKVPPPSPFNDLIPPGGTKAENASDAVPLPSEPPNFDAIFSQKPTASESLPKPDETSSRGSTSSTGRSSVSENPPPQFNPKPLPSESSSSRSPFEDPPIPSPFDRSMPPRYQTPSVPPFKEAEIKAEALNTPYAEQVEQQNQQMQQPDWSPPAPAASWENKEIGQNTPFQPLPAGQGQNQTLAIVSLVLGILSIPCCGFILLGIAAVVTGFMAKNKTEQNPNEYGGRGLALGGIILGGITILIGIILNIVYFLVGLPMNF
ncbi:hypothetical protein BH20BAC1_BH20BAC1_19490 [soil metagenome]